jgi:hypothetical protein
VPDRTARPFIYKKMVVLFAVVIYCFTAWEIAADMTAPMVAAVKRIFTMSTSQASPVQFSYHGAYFVLAFRAAFINQRPRSPPGCRFWRRRQILRRGRSSNGNRRRRADATGPREEVIGAMRAAFCSIWALWLQRTKMRLAKRLGHASITMTTSTYYTANPPALLGRTRRRSRPRGWWYGLLSR